MPSRGWLERCDYRISLTKAARALLLARYPSFSEKIPPLWYVGSNPCGNNCNYESSPYF
jgi:hypothetical protein